MRYVKYAISAVAIGALAACGQQPLPDVAQVGQEIVITAGAMAPAAAVEAPRVTPLSDFDKDGPTASLGGSTAEPVNLKPSTCAEGSSQTVTITYAITGRQASPASFKVNTKWVYDGSNWIGSSSETVDVPAREAQDAPTVRTVDLIVTNGSTADSGVSTLTVPTFDRVTSSPASLNFDNSTATVHVSFNPCPVANTEPWLTVPDDFTVAAEDATGADVDFSEQVTYGDAEDAVEDLILECIPASGTRFPLGQTVVTCRVTDTGGLFAEGSFTITVEDQTPPEFHGVEGPYEVIATSLSGWSLDLSALGITVSDNVSQPDDIEVDCEPTQVPIGVGAFGTQVSCTATDEAGNESAASFHVDVTLPGASGDLHGGVMAFQPPLRMAPVYSAHKRGSTIPHKIGRPTVGGEELVIDPADLALVLNVRGNSGEVGNVEVTEPTAASTTWRWDENDQQYIFNLGSRNLTGGTDYWTTVSYKGIILARTTFGVRR